MSASQSESQVGLLLTELNNADPALVNNDAILATILSASNDCIKILDLEGRLQFMSEGGKRVMEVDDFSALKGCPWSDLWAEEGNVAARHAVAEARTGKATRFLGAANTGRGTPKYWDVRVLPVFGGDGKPTHIISISSDITESRSSDETIARLVAETQAAVAHENEALRRLLKDAPSFMCVLSGPEHRFELMNDAYFQLVGHRSIIGMTVREGLPELAGQGFYELLDNVFRTGETFIGRGLEIDLQRTPNAAIEKAFLNFVYQPIRDETGVISGIFVEGSDITDQKRAELALRESEVQVKLALSAAQMGVWQCQFIDGKFVNLKGDDRATTLLGGTPGEQSSFDTFAARLHPDDRAAIGPAAMAALVPGGDGILNLEYRIIGRNGEKDRWVHARAQAMSSSQGKRLIGTVRDITDRREAEVMQSLLSTELQHRIKNSLAMVNAIAAQTLKGDDIAERRQAFSARIDALAHAHDLLTSSAWQKASLLSVIEKALTPHISGDERFIITGTNLQLTAKQSLSMALAIHELATNAAKYGALSVPDGKVYIDWTTDALDQRDNRQFQLTWRESGGPVVDQPTRKGFGSRLITRVLAADFQGEVSIEYQAQGVVCVLASPISSVMAVDLSTTTNQGDA